MKTRVLAGVFIFLAAARVSAQDWAALPVPMQDARWAPASVVLNDRHSALIVGGYSFRAHRTVGTADRFDEKTRRLAPCRGRLTFPRNFASATLLPGGQALIAGGYNTVWGTLDTAEVYDPARDSFTLLPAHLVHARELFTATALDDGRVLLVGGFNTQIGKTQAAAEIFDPITQTFVSTNPLAQDRFGHDAVKLADGRVLIVGGTHWFVGLPGAALASAEIYDPKTGRFHTTSGKMAAPRDRPTASLLPNGTVLIAGGQNDAGGVKTAAIFDPKTEQFAPLASRLQTARMAHSAVSLPDGRVLLAGGWCSDIKATTGSLEIYDPATQMFTSGPSLPQSGHDLALLAFSDGLVLAAGGKQVENGHERSLFDAFAWQIPPKTR